MLDAATEAGAEDVQPATGDDNEVAGFKVGAPLQAKLLYSRETLSRKAGVVRYCRVHDPQGW